jgi:hypothetical protein
VAEEELALEMAHHTLHRVGVDDAAIDAMLFTVRHRRMIDNGNHTESDQRVRGADTQQP